MSDAAANSAGARAEAWWRNLALADDGITPAQGRKRAALARLRRAGTPLEAMMEPEALRLIQMLPHSSPDRVAVVAGTLATVRKPPVAAHIVRTLGRQSLDDEESATLSEARFRRLLQTPAEELLDPMRRLVRLVKEETNVRHLAESILYWGNRRKTQWIFDYYGASSAAPSPQAEARSTPT